MLKALAHMPSYVTAVEQKGETSTTFAMYEKAKAAPAADSGADRVVQRGTVFQGGRGASCLLLSEEDARAAREKEAGSLEIVKKVLIGIKGLIAR